MSAVFSTQVLVDSYLENQDASSGSVELTRSASLMTRHNSITCQLTSALLSQPPPNSHRVQNEDRDREIPETFSDDSKLEPIVHENDHTALQYHLSNPSEKPEICKDPATGVSWPSDAARLPLAMQHQSMSETVESFDRIDKVRTKDSNRLVNMLCGLSSVVIETSKTEHSDQDAGLCVIITPPDDSWETSCCTAYNNRIGPQYLASLIVPAFYQFTSRLIKYEEWTAIYCPPVGTVSYDHPTATPRRVPAVPLFFSRNGCQEYLWETINDGINCYLIAGALQRHQVKAAAVTASLKAHVFRVRYDAPGFLETIEPRFKWIDPAEILIESFRHTPQSVTVYTSHRPCSVPHIAIHEAPPNDPYVVWSNSTVPQDYCFLAISSPNISLWEQHDGYQMVDDFLIDTSSLCDSPAPLTPKDFSTTLEPDLDILFDDNTYDTGYHDHNYQQYEDGDFVIPQYSEPQSSEMAFPLRSKFFIPDDDDEKDSLPPLDDWYIAIANRCMPPEEAVAVAAAAAAAMSVSCH